MIFLAFEMGKFYHGIFGDSLVVKSTGEACGVDIRGEVDQDGGE